MMQWWKQAMGWNEERKMSKPCWEKGSAGALLLLLLWAQLEKKLQPSGFSDHGRTDQLEDRNIILNSKLILVSNDYWNKIKPHHRNVQTIGFQNLPELTQDLVVVLKDHEFLSHISGMYRIHLWWEARSNTTFGRIHDLSTQQQGTGSILVNFESLLFVDSCHKFWFYSSSC